jgi:tetratricopeptide (TPR) repeat protein
MTGTNLFDGTSVRLADAERQYRRIAGLSNPAVLQNIAELLVDQGRVPEAEEWYQRAADAGNDYAIGCLAELAGRRGDAENETAPVPGGRNKRGANRTRVPWPHPGSAGSAGQAVEHLKTAAEAREASAANNLGLLCADHGAVAEAHYWYLLAAELSPEAAPLWNLGKLLWSERRLGQAAWAGLIITCHTQLLLARPLADDLRLPWERRAQPGRLTPTRVRRGFRNIRANIPCPATQTRQARTGRPQDRRTAAPHPAATWENHKRERTLNARRRQAG